MKFRINNYQVVFATGSRDKIKLDTPIYTDDIEAERIKLKARHEGMGLKVVGINIDYEYLK